MRAIDDLLSNYQHIIADLTVVTGSKGVFDVHVDGDVLYSKHSERRHAEPGEVLELFTQKYGDGILRYSE